MAFANMTEVREANERRGRFWFSENTLRFFGARVESPLIDGRFWVESRDSYDGNRREYKIAEVAPDGDISYLSDENVGSLTFTKKKDAEGYLKEMVAA